MKCHVYTLSVIVVHSSGQSSAWWTVNALENDILWLSSAVIIESDNCFSLIFIMVGMLILVFIQYVRILLSMDILVS